MWNTVDTEGCKAFIKKQVKKNADRFKVAESDETDILDVFKAGAEAWNYQNRVIY